MSLSRARSKAATILNPSLLITLAVARPNALVYLGITKLLNEHDEYTGAGAAKHTVSY